MAPLYELLDHLVTLTTIYLNNKYLQRWLGVQLTQTLGYLQGFLVNSIGLAPLYPNTNA